MVGLGLGVGGAGDRVTSSSGSNTWKIQQAQSSLAVSFLLLGHSFCPMKPNDLHFEDKEK